jgi:MerR family redox-sensitive transcriptional activator SoxR
VALLTIGEVARQTGLRTSAIRYYEDEGLLLMPVRESGQRRYTGEVFPRLAVVRMAQEAGFTIAEIRTLLTGFPAGTSASARWRELARCKLPDVEARIARLQAVRSVLWQSLACGCLTLDACATIGWHGTETHGTA